MSDLRPTGTKIKLGNNEYGMRFTLNAIDEIQEHFNISISQLNELITDEKTMMRNLRYILMLLINEDIDCVNDELETGSKIAHLDERYVGRHIDAGNITGVTDIIYASFIAGAPKDDDGPNPASEQPIN